MHAALQPLLTISIQMNCETQTLSWLVIHVFSAPNVSDRNPCWFRWLPECVCDVARSDHRHRGRTDPRIHSQYIIKELEKELLNSLELSSCNVTLGSTIIWYHNNTCFSVPCIRQCQYKGPLPKKTPQNLQEQHEPWNFLSKRKEWWDHIFNKRPQYQWQCVIKFLKNRKQILEITAFIHFKIKIDLQYK